MSICQRSLRLDLFFKVFAVCESYGVEPDVSRGGVPAGVLPLNHESYMINRCPEYRKPVGVLETNLRFAVGFFTFLVPATKVTGLRATSPERRCSSRTFRYGYLVTT